MNTVKWSDALALDFEPMDNDHRTFVDLLARAQQADDSQLEADWKALIEHAQKQFAREDQWMSQSQFANTDNHTLQHRVVLSVMAEGLAATRAGQTSVVRDMANELAAWLAKHTQLQDAPLALHMRRNPLLPATL